MTVSFHAHVAENSMKTALIFMQLDLRKWQIAKSAPNYCKMAENFEEVSIAT
jgi:hypothetical protein